MASWFGKIRRTPITVTFVILFFLVLGAATLFQAAVSYGILHVSMMQTDRLSMMQTDRRYFQSSRDLMIASLLGLPTIIVNLLVGVGLLARKSWARKLGIAVCCINVLLIIIVTPVTLALTPGISSFFAPDRSISSGSTLTALFLLHLLRRFGNDLHYLWGYAFVGCLLLKDQHLKRYISTRNQT
jgi:hypothetical protein